jgi:dimethylhistidine N-methyltransferase
LVELGSGNAAKTRILIEAFLRRRGFLRYVPIDICRVMLEDSSLQLLRDYSRLEILALAAEYHEGLRHLQTEVGGSKLILWLGSNIGNFERTDAVDFLRRVRHTMTASDGLLVGIDLRKDPATLERAYDDAQGVTGEFNLNLLVRINRELGGRFDPDAFEHRAVYNDKLGRIEMYLVSRWPQRVKIDNLGLEVPFAAGEAIHTENSYKYSEKEIADLSAASGLRLERQCFDRLRQFSENLFVLAPSG